MNLKTLHGDCRETLIQIPDGTVQMCVTSPPYWGLRSYLPKDHPDKWREIGQEKTPEQFVETLVGLFREVRRVLHDSGTVWLNIGDSYAANRGGTSMPAETISGGISGRGDIVAKRGRESDYVAHRDPASHGLKHKDLCMIPWRVALALQADGWWLRSVICWHKKSCMPESVTDRPTNSWEPIFLLAKSQRYFYDAEAVKEQVAECSIERAKYSFDASKDRNNTARGGVETFDANKLVPQSGMRNQRNVWSLGPEPYSEAHFATYPTEIPRRAILAGTSARGCCPNCLHPWVRVSAIDWQPGCKCNAGDPIPCTVLDPFGGSGTTGQVAVELGRKAILCELNEHYLPLINKRTNITPGLKLA
jgi:DNA modification methylase